MIWKVWLNVVVEWLNRPLHEGFSLVITYWFHIFCYSAQLQMFLMYFVSVGRNNQVEINKIMYKEKLFSNSHDTLIKIFI